MDYLDPKKRKQHLIRLAIGYVLIATALLLTTIILLYQAYGFGFKNGEVIQNGLIFVSSKPNPADIYVDGQKRAENTNTRLLMSAGQYTFELKRDGYQSWKRAINIEGGSVVRFDYPFLFPKDIKTTATKEYEARPLLVTESLDRKWLFVQTGQYNTFEVFDLTKPKEAPKTLTVPANLFTLTGGVHSLKLVEWASDNKHFVLQHTTDSNGKIASEYILVDRTKVGESINLTKLLGVNPTEIQLRDKKYDKYYLFDKEARTLSTATLEAPTPELVLDNVFDFKTHGKDVILYATSEDAEPGKTAIKVYDDSKEYVVRNVALGDTYLIDIARYDNAWMVTAGAPADNKVYVYKDPVKSLREKPDEPLVPVQVLKVPNPAFVSFSDNARFVMAQSGQQFAIYDNETEKGYAYASEFPMDATQSHAKWMDGHRLMFVSNGKTVVFDFDNTNHVTLNTLDSTYPVLFDQDYERMYTMSQEPATANKPARAVLNNTLLVTDADL